MILLSGKKSALLFWITFVIAKFVLYLKWDSSFFASALVYLITGGWKHTRSCLRTILRDLFALNVLRKLYTMLWIASWHKQNIRNIFAGQLKRRGRDAIAMLHLEEKWTFGYLEDYSNQIGNFLISHGIKHQENIAVFMESEPRLVSIWFGAAKAGIASGLLNSNVRKDALVNCFTQLSPKVIFVSASLTKAMTEAGIAGALPEEDIVLFAPTNLGCQRTTEEELAQVTFKRLVDVTANQPTTLPPLYKETKTSDTLIYVFTSGTTGLPKAAIITFARYMFMGSAIKFFCRVYTDDIIYCPLPLYHTAGGIVGVGCLLLHGHTFAIRTRFSASKFWSDCIKYNCTVVQYVGEVCRYLLTQPYRDEERQHKVRLAIGNGIRKDIWPKFVERFGIERMGEFYGATESNCNLANSENKLGAIGYTSVIIPPAYPVLLIRTDAETGEIIRDPNTGFCTACEYGEVGQLIGKIKRKSPVRNFEGYVNRKETSKKIGTNIFKQGDLWFLSGDLLYQDDEGYLYFVDRLGDTFRWRGENVSTTEVENVAAKTINFADCAVYGVAVPGNEGKAGMLCVAIPEKKNGVKNGVCKSGDMEVTWETDLLVDLATVFAEQLPVYARPLFVRFSKSIDTTDTFKFRKLDLVKAGFDPSKVGNDRLYYLNSKANVYTPLDESVFTRIQANQIRF